MYLPAFLAALIASYQAYLRKGKFVDLFYISLLSFPFIAIIATLKTLVLLKYGLTSYSFLSGNLPYLVLAGFAFALSARELLGTKAVNIFRYFIASIVLIMIALFTMNVYKAVDLVSYGLLGLIIVHASYSFYLASTSKDRLAIAAVVLSHLTISTDILLKILYYYNLLPLFPTIEIRLSLRIAGTLFTVFLAVLYGRSISSEEQVKEIVSARKRTMWRASLIVITASLVIVMVMFSTFMRVNSYVSTGEDSVRLELSAATNEATSQFENFLSDSINHLNCLAETGALDQSSGMPSQSEVISFYKAHSSVFSSITLMDTNGIITYTYPFVTSIGADISSQPHVKQVLLTKQLTLSNPIMSVQGFPAIIIHIPVFKSNQFLGTVAGLIDARNIRSHINLDIYKNYNFIFSEDGIVLATNIDNSMILKPFDEVIKQFGSDNYFSQSFNFISHEKKFQVLLLDNKAAFLADARTYVIDQWIFSGFLIILLLTILLISAESLRREDYELVLAVQSALAREKSEHSKVLSTQQKISELSQFVYTISIDTPMGQFFDNLLAQAAHIIPNLQKASVWLSTNGIVTPIASYGYDLDALGKMKLSASYDEQRWSENKIYVVDSIGNQMAEGENEEIIHALGIHDIKQTLVIPLYIGPQYKGALFFDNFDSTTAFTDEDISLAKIVMRISTFFIGQKGMLDELLSATADIKNLSLRLEQLISFQSGISPSEDEKTFFGKLLTLALSIVPHAEKGSVYLAEEGMLKAVCWSGYPDEVMQKLEIPLENELATLKGGSAYIVKNVGVNDFATEEERALAESMGVPTIKAVLNVPLFIDNNYVAGLFLDAFSSENAFDENDVKVVKAISNIANLFLRTRKLLSERRITNIVNNVVIETLRMIAKSANVEDAAIAFLRNLSSRLRIELIGAVFILRLLDRAFVIKVNSSNASSEYIEEVDLPEINEPSLFKKDELLPNGLLESLGDFENAFVAETPEGLYAVFALGKGKLTADEKQILSDTATDVIPILENRELLMEVQKSYIETLVALSRAVDSKDPYTREHSEGVTLYSYLIGKKLNLSFEDMKTLLYAAILHDIGKIGIPDSILLKPGKLTADEYEIVKMHPKLGEDIVGKIGFLREPAEVLLHHHERYDGKGYPSQLAGVEIPFLSRILGVADAFDAMTTERPYRKAMTFDEAVSELVKGKGLQFDPELVDVFVSIPREEIEKALANKSVEEILDETLVGGGYYLKGKLSQTDGNSPHISG